MVSRPFKLRNLLIPMSCIGVMAYFSYHAVHGQHGLYAFWSIKERTAALEKERDRLVGVRKDLEHKVALMRPESLDPDMLGEQARVRLNMAHPNDITMFRSASAGIFVPETD